MFSGTSAVLFTASHSDPDLVHPKASLARQRVSSLYRQARNCLANYEARLK